MRLGARMAMLFLSAIMATAPVLAAPAAQPDAVSYQVRKGDNLFSLARAYLRSAGDYRAVQRLNHVADPHSLPVGRTLIVPRALLRFKPIEARVLAWRGDVRIMRAGRPAQVAVDAVVQEGDAIETGANAFLSLGLPDDSIVALPSQSQLRVARMRRYAMGDAVERQFDVVAGRARAVVTPLRKADDQFRVVTPSAVSAVRGTELRVAYDPKAARGATEVLDGHVAVAGGARSVMVDAGRGVVAGADGPGEPVALLPAPTLQRPGKVQDGEGLSFVVEPVAGAQSYHVQIAKDAGFIDVVGETEAGPLVALPGVEEGSWFVRVSAIDANGLEGLVRTYSFKRHRNIVETETGKRKVGRYQEYLFRWRASGAGAMRYRFQLFRDGEAAIPLIDEPGLTKRSMVVTDLPPGGYSWRVQTLQFIDGGVNQKWSPAETLTISPDE